MASALRLLPSVLTVVLSLAGCQYSAGSSPTRRSDPEPARPSHVAAGVREVRATGTIRAVREFAVLTPQITGQSARLTLTAIVSTGTRVEQGDILAEFDRVQQLDHAREAQAKYEDFSHQVEQRQAENRSNAEKRAAEMSQAKADFAKAELQIRKGPILAEVERLKAEARLGDAKLRIESLEKSQAAHEKADAAALRILELKRERQKVALERAQRNLDKLVVRAPLGGMVALENTWRSGSMGPPQEGDPMYPGQPLVRIFDPSQMDVVTMVGEPDGAVLVPGVRAKVRLDAYPELEFHARLETASPVAAGAVGSPIKRFNARFRLDNTDPHLLPDLAAAVVISLEQAPEGKARP